MSKTKRQQGTVLFSNITIKPTFNGKPTDKYELTVTLTEEQAADAEGNGGEVNKSEYQGQAQYKMKFKTKFKLDKKLVVDRYKNPYIDNEGNLKEIPRGSLVCVHYNPVPYEMMGKEGITHYLQALQVIEENSSVDFDDYSEELEVGEDGEY